MLGSKESEGLVPRAVRQLFADAAGLGEQGWRYDFHASILEIYNEELRDLLGPGPPPGKKHTVSRPAGRERCGGWVLWAPSRRGNPAAPSPSLRPGPPDHG